MKKAAGAQNAVLKEGMSAPDTLIPVTEVVEQVLDNLLVMIRQERQALCTGPSITIYVGSIAIGGIYKRAAMASSSVLNKHFTKNPASTEYRFEQDAISPESVHYLLITWMRETCQPFEAFAVPMQEAFSENIALLRAARLLGMERYAKHILSTYINYLKTELPTYEEITIVEKNATSDKDPLWTSMVST